MDRTLYPSQSYGSGRVYCEVSFLTNNTSSPLMSTVDGSDSLLSLTRTGAGVIVAVLKDKFPGVVGATADIDDSTDTADFVTCATTVSAAGLVTVTLRTRVVAGTKTDFTGRKVTLTLFLKNTKGWTSTGVG